MINKSLLSNVVALMLVMVGYLMESPYQRYILNTGLFALSGGITNWLAVHMLFAVSYTHLRAHETSQDLVCRLLLEKKK